jgi:hypothetical protein
VGGNLSHRERRGTQYRTATQANSLGGTLACMLHHATPSLGTSLKVSWAPVIKVPDYGDAILWAEDKASRNDLGGA